MAKTIVGLFDTFPHAQNVVEQLINAGIDRSNVSVVSRNRTGMSDASTESSAAEAAGAGAIGGTVLGGTLGLLVGIGALAIPGIGPVIAAGPLAAALGSTALGAGIGAAAGGLIGALVGAGVPEEDANMYAEGVRRGGTLVTVNAEDTMADRAYSIMQQNGASDIDTQAAGWRESGWNRFDESAEPYELGDDGASNWEESSKLGTAGGTVAGAATGAAMGSVAGPVGTVIGGVAGAAVGAGVGAAGDAAGEAAEDSADGDMRRTRSRGYYDYEHRGDREHSDSPRSNWEESSKVGTAGGTVAGAATGAAMGSVAGPVGTVVGGAAGAVVGAGAGAAGDAAGEAAEDRGWGWSDYERDFRSDYDTRYANSGYTWDNYSTAYRYGYDVAMDPRYKGRHWDDIETTLHGAWDENRYGPWERFKDAVRHSWERTKDAVR